MDVIDNLTLRDPDRDKALVVRVTFPKAVGTFPIILFSHCVGGGREDFAALVEHWASNGYVVLQADHADTGDLGQDWQDRARDMSLILDSLDEIGVRVPALASRMDPERVGAGGHLIGAYASCALVGMKVFQGPAGEPVVLADPRVDAALLLSPQGRGQGLTESSWESIDKPMLVAAGSETSSRRTSNPPEWRTEPYRFAKPGDKYLLWVEGMDNSYGGLLTGALEPESASLIQEVTTAFWDAHLKGDDVALHRLRNWPNEEAEGVNCRVECNTPPESISQVAPFLEDAGSALYRGGFDCASFESHDTAWICKGMWGQEERVRRGYALSIRGFLRGCWPTSGCASTPTGTVS